MKKITLNNEKRIEYLVNLNIGILNIFKDEYNFEEILKSLKTIPPQMNTRDPLWQGNEFWALSQQDEVQGMLREKLVKILKSHDNKREIFQFMSLGGFYFFKDWAYYECSILERTVENKFKKMISHEKIWFAKYSGKMYLCFSQQKKDGKEKTLYKEINFKEINAKLQKIHKRLKDSAKTPTQE